MPWRRVWQRTPVFLPAEPHGQRSLAGYSPRRRKEPDRTEAPSPPPCLQPAVTKSPESLRGPPPTSATGSFVAVENQRGARGWGMLSKHSCLALLAAGNPGASDRWLPGPCLLPSPGGCSAAEATGTPGTLFLGSPRVAQLRTRSSQVSGEVLRKNADAWEQACPAVGILGFLTWLSPLPGVKRWEEFLRFHRIIGGGVLLHRLFCRG